MDEALTPPPDAEAIKAKLAQIEASITTMQVTRVQLDALTARYDLLIVEAQREAVTLLADLKALEGPALSTHPGGGA